MTWHVNNHFFCYRVLFLVYDNGFSFIAPNAHFFTFPEVCVCEEKYGKEGKLEKGNREKMQTGKIEVMLRYEGIPC